MENQETINKLRRIYKESTNETAKAGAKAKLEQMGVSLTDEKPKGELSQDTIDKLLRIYKESTNETAKAGAKKKLEDAGVSLSGEEPKKKTEKAKSEPKSKAEPKAKTQPKKPSAQVKDPYDCDDLISKEKERKAKAKANAVKRANAPKKTPATKNKEAVSKTNTRVTKSVESRAKKGEVKVAELEKLIAEYEEAIKKLKTLLSKVKSGKKFANGGNMGMMDSEHSREYHKIKDHHCGCGDKMEHGGGIGGNKNAKYLSSISSERKAKVLQNIAKHYGISVKEAENEVMDADAEDIYEYIANDKQLQMSVYTEFKSMNVKMARGGDIDDIGDNFNVIFEKPNSDVAYKELINAKSIQDLKQKFKKKHPTCKILNISKEYARGGNLGLEEYIVVVRDTESGEEEEFEIMAEDEDDAEEKALSLSNASSPKIVSVDRYDEYYDDDEDIDLGGMYANGGMLNNGKLYLKHFVATIHEDSYEEGEGNYVNEFSENINMSFDSGKELLEYIKSNIIYDSSAEFFVFEDGRVSCSLMVDNNNSSASKSEIERWKKGEEKLYVADYSFTITIMQEETPSQEDLSKMLGINMYAKGGTTESVDRLYSALKSGKRISKKFATVNVRGGSSYRRRNANQYGKVKGGNTYYEYSDNRTDSRKYLAKGGNIEKIAQSIFDANEMKGKIKTNFGDKTIQGLNNMIENDSYTPNEIAISIFNQNEKNGKIATTYGNKTIKGLTEMIEDSRRK
jgi:hypothetical protein